MSMLNKIFLSAVLMVGAHFVFMPNGWALDGDKIIAVVNDEAITLKDLRAYVASMYGQLRIENQDPFEIDQIMRQYEKKGIDQLVEDKLILGAAKDKDLVIKPQTIDKRVQEIKSRYPSEYVFQTMLEHQGMTLTDIRNKIVDQLEAKYMVDNEVRSKIFVNPQEVTDYYGQHHDDYVEKARVNLDSIFISFDQGQDEAKKEARDVYQELKAGKDFGDLAKAHSDLPSVGTMEEGQLKLEIEEKVFNMKEGEISEPMGMDNGIYIFKFNRKSPRETKSLRDAKEEIYAKLFEDKFRKRFEEWISKLREKAYVEIRP